MISGLLEMRNQAKTPSRCGGRPDLPDAETPGGHLIHDFSSPLILCMAGPGVQRPRNIGFSA